MMTPQRLFTLLLCVIMAFAILTNGGHDLWAATIVHGSALVCFTALLWIARRERSNIRFDTTFLAPVCLLAAAMALSFVGSIHPEESRLALGDWISAILIFLTARILFRNESARDDMLVAIAVLACAEEAVILRQHWSVAAAIGTGQGIRHLILSVLGSQTPGTMVNSSATTAFFVLWFPIFAGLGLRRWKEERRVPLPLAIGSAACLSGILSLDSHWGFLCLLASIPLLYDPKDLMRRIRRRPRMAVTLASVTALALGIILNWKLGQTTRLNGGKMFPGENLWRLYWWASGLKMFRSAPWLGVGIGNFPSAYLAFKTGMVQNTLYAHNFVISLLAETGLVGISAAIFAAGSIAKRWLRDSTSFGDRWPFLLGLASFTLFGMIGLSIEYLSNLLSAGLVIGAVSTPFGRGNAKPRFSVAVSLTAAALSAMPFLAAPWMASCAVVNGRGKLEVGDAGGAIRDYSAAVELDPLSADARHGLAMALRARHRTYSDAKALDEAIARQKEAIALDRLNVRYVLELADLLRLKDPRDGR